MAIKMKERMRTAKYVGNHNDSSMSMLYVVLYGRSTINRGCFDWYSDTVKAKKWVVSEGAEEEKQEDGALNGSHNYNKFFIPSNILHTLVAPCITNGRDNRVQKRKCGYNFGCNKSLRT